jgi:hypothetical protein
MLHEQLCALHHWLLHGCSGAACPLHALLVVQQRCCDGAGCPRQPVLEELGWLASVYVVVGNPATQPAPQENKVLLLAFAVVGRVFAPEPGGQLDEPFNVPSCIAHIRSLGLGLLFD